MISTEDKIREIVEAGGEGKVYFPSDFFECGPEKAVSKALQRLTAKGTLMRMYRGIYCSPCESHFGLGPLPADAKDVAEAVAKRDGVRLTLCFGQAQNALGLSTQVVLNPVYSTDGPSRMIPYRKGARPIVFYHVPPKAFQFKNKLVQITYIALLDIGKDSLWEFDMDALEGVYSRVPYEDVREDLRILPSWMRTLILQYYGKNRFLAV